MDRKSHDSILNGHRKPVVAAILAGGSGSRIGGHKARVHLGGRPLIDYAWESLRHAGLDPFVVAKAEHAFAPEGIRVVVEPDEPRHPLLGIETALRAASGRPVLVVPCDLPFLPASLLGRLATAPGNTVIAGTTDGPQPLVGRYGAQSLGTITSALAARQSVRSVLELLRPKLLDVTGSAEFGDPEIIFHNVNTPEDLARAEEILRRSGCDPTGTLQ